MQFYYPGSPSLSAGWYSGFARTSADAMTFSAPGAGDFTSESVNAGSAFTSEVTFFSATLPPNALSVGDILSIRFFRAADAVSANHTTNAKVNGTSFANSVVSTSINQGTLSLSAVVLNPTTLRGVASPDNVVASAARTATIDTSTTNDITLTGSLAAASMFMCIPSAKTRIE